MKPSTGAGFDFAAVRAMTAVATAQTEAEWIKYAKGHRVEEVERKVAVRYPYEFTVNAEVHQAYESLTAVSRRLGRELTVHPLVAPLRGAVEEAPLGLPARPQGVPALRGDLRAHG